MRSFTDQVNDFRRRLLVAAIACHNGNMSATARALTMSRNSLGYWMHALDIPRDSRRYWGGRRPGAGRTAMPDGVGGRNG